MAVSSKSKSLVLLQLALAVFMIILGIGGILPNTEESVFSLSNGDLTLEVIFGVIEVFCGVVLLVGFFEKISRGIVSIVTLVVFGFWTARIVLSRFIFGITFAGGNIIFRPDMVEWALILTSECIILLGIFLVYQRNTK